MMTWPTINMTIPCPHVGGKGTNTTENPNGTFDTAAEQRYPTTARHLCDTCDGLGEEEVITCRICGADERDCTCTEDDLDAWSTLEVAA